GTLHVAIRSSGSQSSQGGNRQPEFQPDKGGAADRRADRRETKVACRKDRTASEGDFPGQRAEEAVSTECRRSDNDSRPGQRRRSGRRRSSIGQGKSRGETSDEILVGTDHRARGGRAPV